MKHCNIESMGKGKPNFDFDTYKKKRKSLVKCSFVPA